MKGPITTDVVPQHCVFAKLCDNTMPRSQTAQSGPYRTVREHRGQLDGVLVISTGGFRVARAVVFITHHRYSKVNCARSNEIWVDWEGL